MLLKLKSFGGMVPILGDRAIPEDAAVDAVNTWLYGNELRGVRPAAPLPNGGKTLAAGQYFAYGIPRGTVGGDPTNPSSIPPTSYLGDRFWMVFNNVDTSVVRSPLVNDSYERYYWAAPGLGAYYNTKARIFSGLAPYKLGVNAPTVAPSLVVVGGSAPSNVTRAYVVTWATIYGEESAPSPPVTVAGKADGSWNLTAIPQPSAGDVLDRAPISQINIYRTITAASGTTTFFKVTDVALGVTSYSDVIADTVVADNLLLEATNYSLPPANIEGMVLMPNGFLIGWVGSKIYMSEPFHPHAWPAEYDLSVEYPVVGMGILGGACAVLTAGNPYAITGVKPVATSLTKSTTNEPCLSRGSIVTTTRSIFYASPNGLVSMTPAGVNNVTAQLISREQWKMDYSPQYLRAAQHGDTYLALRRPPAGATGQPVGAFQFDMSALKVAAVEFEEATAASNIFNDPWSGRALIVMPGPHGALEILAWDDEGPALWPARWKSKEFQLPIIQNFGAYSIYWDEDRFYSSSVNTAMLGADDRVRFRAWCNRALVYDQVVPIARNGKPMRLPSGFKGDIWQFEVRCRAPVYSLHVASTIEELKSA